MTITMQDKSNVSVRWIKGNCRLTFHSLANRAILLPYDLYPTVEMIEKLYLTLKGGRK